MFGIACGQLVERAGDALFERLADLARHRRVAGAEPGRHRRQRRAEARAALVEDEASAQSLHFGEGVSARLLLGRQEAREQEAIGRKPRQRQRGDRGAGAREGDDVVSRRTCVAHQLEARIGDHRRARIGHQRDRLAAQPRDQPGAHPIGIMVMIGGHRRFRADVTEQFGGHARIFRGDQIRAAQHVGRTGRQVAKIADRGRDDVEPGRKRIGHRGSHGRGLGATATADTGQRCTRRRIGRDDAACGLRGRGAAWAQDRRRKADAAASGTAGRSPARGSARSRRGAGAAERPQCRGRPVDRQCREHGADRFGRRWRAPHHV